MGSTSRATNGNVMNVVARTMPGMAKMMWMSCASSHGPEHAARAQQQHEDQARR